MQKWLEPKYTRLIGPHREKHVFLCAEDFYALRCSYLHEGSDVLEQRARKALNDFHFISPMKDGSLIHMNQSNGTLQLQADIFAMDVAEAVDAWAQSVVSDVTIQQRMASLLVVHDSSRSLRF
ncbi:hypothetical protein [Hydrogenophaga palleronii]|uniref:hypothetical protein n=1 Tax=Hydrogenophaga palleronii TaxID=65655 RepID=UPI000AF0A245|nr:hypothetical protein [Hydrogenophaga palleronii]